MIGTFGVFHKGIFDGNIADIEQNLKDIYNYNEVDNDIKIIKTELFFGGFICRKEIQSSTNISWLHENDRYIFILDGYLSDYDLKDDTFQKKLLNAIYKYETRLNEIEGEYNITVFDKKDSLLWLLNDRIASRPIYKYFDLQGSFVFSSERKIIFNILNTSPELNNSGIMEFFLFSHPLANNDIYKNIKPLSPATILQVNKNNQELIKSYWLPEYNIKSTKQNEIAKDLCFSVKEYTKKTLSRFSKIGMGLSGGLDSRVIAGSIDKRDNVFARTFGDEDSYEVTAAKEIANIYNFEHVISSPPQLKFSDYIYPSVWRSEGSIPFSGLKSIKSHHYLKDKMLVNLGGQFGDILTGKTILPYMLNPFLSRNNFIKKYINNYMGIAIRNPEAIKCLFKDDFLDSYYAKAIRHFKLTLNEINVSNNSQLAIIWDIKHRQPRFTFNSASVDNYIFFSVRPFSSYKFINNALSIHPNLRLGQLLYKKSIYINFPELRKVINSNTGHVLKKTTYSNFFDLVSYYRKVKFGNYYDKKGYSKADMIRQDKKLYNYIMDFINSDSFPDHIMCKIGIERLLNKHYFENRDFSNAIGLLATFMASHELFIQNNYSTIPEIAKPF